MWENSTKSKFLKFLMNNQNIMLGYPPPMEKLEKSKDVKQPILINVDLFLIDPFLLREYHSFSQKTEISLEQ